MFYFYFTTRRLAPVTAVCVFLIDMKEMWKTFTSPEGIHELSVGIYLSTRQMQIHFIFNTILTISY